MCRQFYYCLYLYKLFGTKFIYGYIDYILMKLQKQKVGKYKNRTYYKYSILVPKDYIEKLGWIEGQELKADSVMDKGLFLCPI